MARIGIVYYSMYGHLYDLAQQIAKGVADAGGQPELRKAPELLPPEVIEQQGLQPFIDRQAGVPTATVDELPSFDGLVLGSGTRYGNMTGQLRNFLDQTGGLWATGALHGKPAGFFTGASTMHGGHESTILTMSTFAFHMGMLVVPAGYAFAEVGSTSTGGSPYGPTVFTPMEGKDGLSQDEIAIAVQYGTHFHGIADKLRG